ncbi:7589_t:CDS:1, partial [Ambispora gerdemannii]
KELTATKAANTKLTNAQQTTAQQITDLQAQLTAAQAKNTALIEGAKKADQAQAAAITQATVALDTLKTNTITNADLKAEINHLHPNTIANAKDTAPD